MAFEARQSLSNDQAGLVNHRRYYNVSLDSQAASLTRDYIFDLGRRSRLTGVWLGLDAVGVGGVGLDVDVLAAGVSLLSTLARIAPTAAAESLAKVGGSVATGVTHPVIAAANLIAAADKVKISVISGVFTTAPTGVYATIEITEETDFDPAAAAAVIG